MSGDKQEQALELVAAGWSHEQAAHKMGVTVSEVGQLIASAMSRIKHSKSVRPQAEVEPIEYALSPREWQVWELLAKGWRNPKMAQYLGIDPSTVKNHVYNLLKSLGVSSRTTAAFMYDSANKPDKKEKTA